ncbi:VOC family protein [Pseudalkalibacillus decolorationis]|uniref:VOC family protein n=1 Tax=Pseudalkalibacillus decolorationis TaxID=163879 RepID=UPI002149419E|nr:VOC family protein [Pseudalkalibacillus decolorationis]
MNKLKPLIGNSVVNQIAFVVHDIESASEAFAKLLGIPKPEWFLTGSQDISQVVFKGEPSAARSKLVFINTPSVQIELIEPNGDPSTMREFLDTVGEGIHHIAFDVDHMQDQLTTLEEHGFPVLQTGEFTSSNGRYAYVDTLDVHKTLVELLEREEPQTNSSHQPAEESEIQPLLGTDTITQIAIVVHDIESASDAYCKLFGIEKPSIITAGPSEITKIEFQGKPTEAKAKFMFIKTPLIELELIEPDDDSQSIWKDHLDTKGEGVHHIAFVVKNIQDKIDVLEQMGYPLIQKGYFWNGKGEYAYMDTTSTYKVIIELLEKYED